MILNGDTNTDMILDNLSVRVSSVEYKLDICDTRISDVKESQREAKEQRTEMHGQIDKIEEKVMKNGKTKVSDWVQIILLVAITIIGIIFGV